MEDIDGMQVDHGLGSVTGKVQHGTVVEAMICEWHSKDKRGMSLHDHVAAVLTGTALYAYNQV